MASKQTIIINGKRYDTQTGMPIDDAPAESVPHSPRPASAQSSRVHTPVQRSQTLNRKIVHKHTAPKPLVRPQTSSPKHMDITRSPAISRFAPRPVVQPLAPANEDIKAQPHPVVQKAHQVTRTQHQPIQAPKPSQVIKNEAIAKALNSPSKSHAKQPARRRFPRIFSISTASLAVFLLAGYISYLNMPTISIRVAAVQSGINATYPDYHPSGYRLSGPIAYNDGEVQMRFAANAGPQNFTIKEQRSNLDSSAVVEDYVQPKVGNEYGTHTQSGLTIYTYDNSAAWVNGGILYTIEGNAPLSKDQVLHIATSL